MGDPTLDLFDEANVDWVPFSPDDPAPVVPLVRQVLERRGVEQEQPVVRIEGPLRAGGRGLFGRRRPAGRLVAQVVAGRPGMPLVLTIGDETDEPVGRRFDKAGIVLPDGWTLATPSGTFPWVDVPASPAPEVIVGFVVDALSRLGAPAGEWRAGIDTPGSTEHSHGPDGGHTHGHSHSHSHGDHHHRH